MPRYPHLSSAAHGLTAQVYTSLLGIAQRTAPEVFALNVGDTYRAPPPAAAGTLGGPCGYTPVRGTVALIDAIAERSAAEGTPYARELIQVTAGATSGLDIAVRALTSPGDEVVVLAPFWPLIRGIVSAAGAVPVELPFFDRLSTAGFDPERALRSVITTRTAALYVNSPNNPSGVVLDAATVDVLAQIALEFDLWLLCDTAYGRLSFAPVTHVHQHPLLVDRAVVAHTYSKTYGLAGARVGFVTGPARALQSIADLQCYATYCAARPSQDLLTRVLRDPESERWLAEARAAYREAAERTAETLRVPVPSAGTFVLFDTRPFLRPGETPEGLLVRAAEQGVVITPGSATGSAYASYARLCFTALPLAQHTRALAALERVLYA